MTRVIASLLIVTVLAGACVAESDESVTPWTLDDCAVTAPSEKSHARLWNEAALDAIRRDFPAPTVHARNLFHLSAAMWDAWTVYGDDPGTPLFFEETIDDDSGLSTKEQREVALSFAAYRLLRERYSLADGAVDSIGQFNRTMRSLCLDRRYDDTTGDNPAAVGNRLAALVLSSTSDDGSREADGYVAPYESVNPPLPAERTGADMNDPNRWQPLSFTFATSQGGEPLPPGPQEYVGPHWGVVTPFALAAGDNGAPAGLPLDPGPPPLLGTDDEAFLTAIVEVLEASARLDPTLPDIVDISPGVRGDNPLGTNEGTGHRVNPATGEPYPANPVRLGDWGRAIAEYWADGPDSETPPGHWNTIANEVSDHPDLEHRLAGSGEPVDRLEWDIKLYVALNGALHDAAIAAWGSKAAYDYARPISMIRYLGGLGQSSDPDGPSYDPQGLPLVDGLIEVVTEESSRPGERHDDLRESVGAVAVHSWSGASARIARIVGPGKAPASGVDWILAADWLPFQRGSFVTPAFPGYVSGHSTFSRAAAEVLTAFTGDPFFPGGLASHEIDEYVFEDGPSTPIDLEWATYRDAADEAGQSRIWGGIHVAADDLAGRRMGARCGELAWARAQQLFSGT